MRLHELTEGLDGNQRRAGQVGAEEKASSVSPVLGKKDKQHPFKGRLVGEQGVAEGFGFDQEWMSDTELDQYVPERLQQQWRELLGYDENGNPSALWANLTGGYEPDVNDPQHRALMVKVANKWFAAKKIPNVKFFDVKDADDELEWLVKIGQQVVAEGETEYGPEWDEKIQRLKKLAGMGPLKTVWDPVKRVYKNVPVNQKSDNDQKKSSVKEAQMAPGIKDVLKTKGYKYVGHGQDQDVFIGSDGWVLKVFGWDRDQKKNGFTRAQQSFIDFANFCKKNAGNEFLPNFSGWTSFKFRDQTYLQIRCERLFPLDKKWPTLGKELDNFATLVQKSGAESAIKKYVKVIHDTEGLAIPMFLGKEGLQQFANTLEKVIKLGQSKGYSIDLHSGNFMFGSDGQIVINDPFFTGSYRGGWGGWGL